jgi:uncharacterized damage-inducible protein DinB
MSESLYVMRDRGLLEAMARFDAGFHSPRVILDGLTEEQATARPHGLPHSIADIAGHICYWQEWFNDIAEGRRRDAPEHASGGWPEMAAGGWEALRERLLNSVDTAARLARECPRLDEKLLRPDSQLPVLRRDTCGSGLMQAAMHGAHHLGQIVTIRQLLGLWPPRRGSLTW